MTVVTMTMTMKVMMMTTLAMMTVTLKMMMMIWGQRSRLQIQVPLFSTLTLPLRLCPFIYCLLRNMSSWKMEHTNLRDHRGGQKVSLLTSVLESLVRLCGVLSRQSSEPLQPFPPNLLGLNLSQSLVHGLHSSPASHWTNSKSGNSELLPDVFTITVSVVAFFFKRFCGGSGKCAFLMEATGDLSGTGNSNKSLSLTVSLCLLYPFCVSLCVHMCF